MRAETLIPFQQQNTPLEYLSHSTFEIDNFVISNKDFNNSVFKSTRSNICETKLFFFELIREIIPFTTF